MRAFITTFRVPKAGSSSAEYEDASAVGPPPAGDGEFTGRWLAAAVADGASESLLSGRWAAQLVDRFCAADPKEELADTIAAAAAGWDDVEAGYRRGREETGEPVEWYEEDKLHRGAHATVVGARLLNGRRADAGPLVAWALGDACLFQVRDDEVITAFPVQDPAAFGISPAVVPSRPPDPGKVAGHVTRLATRWREGDLLFLGSDALACWFLVEAAAGGKPWHTLMDLDTDAAVADFATWVDLCRKDRSMRNDDTTLVRIDVL